MTVLDLVGERYVLYLCGIRKVAAPEKLQTQNLYTGQGSIATRHSPTSQWNVLSRFSFRTDGYIGLDLRTFLTPHPFETLCDGTPMEEVTRWLQKPSALLVDAVCAAKLDEIEMWEQLELRQHGGEPYRVLTPTLTFGRLSPKIIEIGFGRSREMKKWTVVSE